jgi:hypothetical protein
LLHLLRRRAHFNAIDESREGNTVMLGIKCFISPLYSFYRRPGIAFGDPEHRLQPVSILPPHRWSRNGPGFRRGNGGKRNLLKHLFLNGL